MDDVTFWLNDIKFNYRVASIIRYDNKILLHKNINEDFYALPGGRIKLREDSKTALSREFVEEMNAKINIRKLVAIVENFFNYDKKKYHEIMLIYECNFEDSIFYNTEVINGVEKEGKLQFVWKKIEDIDNLDIRPTSVKRILCNKTEEFLHIIDKNKLV